MVPQDGFLFDATVDDNVRYGRPGRSDEDVAAAFDDLGLGGWVAGLSDGVRTPVGQRGESLSSVERQVVAIARAYVADPHLLVLDEATSAVDPATEQRLTHARDRLPAGRATLTIADPPPPPLHRRACRRGAGGRRRARRAARHARRAGRRRRSVRPVARVLAT